MDFLLLFLFNGSFSVYTAQADKSVPWTAELVILQGRTLTFGKASSFDFYWKNGHKAFLWTVRERVSTQV